MSIKRTIIAAVVGLTLVALVAPGVAQGVTIDELLAQIAQLQAQLVAMQQGQGGTVVPTGTVACSGVTFTRALVIGSTGQDVKCLQVLLNNNGYTLAQSGAGSPGAETSYFGPITLAAVRTFQVAKGWTPANQVGPLTRAALNALITSTPTVTPGQPVVPTGAGLSVSLASTNPAPGTIVTGQSQFPLARLTFTNGDNAEVTVTQLKVKRIGVSADSSLANVYLFNGATRLTDGAAVSSSVISFNDSTGLFKVPAYGSVTITVASDDGGSAGETVGVQLVASTDITTNASSVNGYFPLTGNLHTIATGTLATLGFAASASTTPTINTALDPQDEYPVFQNTSTVGTRAIDLKRISFRKTGSASNTDLQNFKLYIDGVQVGSTMQLDSKGYVTFDLTSSPKRLEAGARVFKVLADIVGGSNLNFTMHIWNVADVTVVDSQYNANMLVKTGSAVFAKTSTGEQTISSGTLTITKMTDSPSGNIVDGATNAVLAKFQVKAAGEKVKIETLTVRAIFTNTDTTGDDNAGTETLRNGALYANGVQIGSTTSLTTAAAGTQFSLGSSLIVEPGSPVTLEVRADIYDNNSTNNDIDATDTIQVRVIGSSSSNNATGQTSATTIDAPGANVDANTLTVATGSLVLSQYPAYTAQTVVAPITAQKLAHFTLTANTTEAVNVSSIEADLNAVASSYATNLYVVYGANTTSVKSTASATNSWSINYQLPAGQTIDIMVYADISSLATAGTAVASVYVNGTTVSSATAVCGDTNASCTVGSESALAGQNILFSSGSFVESFASTPQNQLVAGNQQVEVARYKLTSSYQQSTVTEMRFSVASDTIASVIASAVLKDGSTVLATVPYNATSDYFNFTGLNVVVPASTSKTLTLAYNLSIPSATAGSWNVDVKPTLTYVKRQDPNGLVSTDTGLTYAANSTIVYRSIPTLTKNTITNNAIVNGQTRDLYKFTVAASPQGEINVKQFKLAVTWGETDQNDALQLHTLKLLKDGVDITSSVSIVDEDLGLDATGASGVSEGNTQIIVTWSGSTEDTIQAGTSSTYTITGVPAAFGATDTAANSSDSVSIGFTADSLAQTATYNYIALGSTLTNILKLFSSAGSTSASAENANLIWSDASAVAHSASTTAGTGDWTNSYLVLGVLGTEAHTK
jgi:hypothetical protein